jgi:hypothetical protein
MEKQLEEIQAKSNSDLEQKWWFRIAKVVYIFLYLFLAVGVIASGVDNFYSYNTDIKSNVYTPGNALVNVLAVMAIGLVIIKATKITFFYIFLAQKPHWKREFTKLF